MLFANVSMGGVGQLSLLVVWLLSLTGLDVGAPTVEGAITGAIAFFGFVWTVYGHFRRKDLKLGLLRK